MNIVNKLTIRHLKQNKRRTLVTIIGVIISVAMITAVATLGVSFLELLKKEAIARDGKWHVVYHDVSKEQVQAIQQDEATESAIITKNYGYAMLDGSANEYKPYLFIRGYNDQGFKNFPIELIEGRLPQSPDEVVVSEHVASNGEVVYELGDAVQLEVGQRQTMQEDMPVVYDQNSSLQVDAEGETIEELAETESMTFTVVGFIARPDWEPTWAPGYTLINYVDEQFLGEDDQAKVLVALDKVDRSLYEHAEKLAASIGLSSDRVDYNSELLRYYGLSNNRGIQTTLYSLSTIIIGVIIAGSVSLIYNAFAISVSERTRHLGMLSSVGATNKQKRNSVFFEGTVIGLISIPIGIIAGLLGIGITFLFINSLIQNVFGGTEDLTVVVTPMSLLIACLLSALTIFISCYMPAMRASRVSAIDAIRQTADIKLTTRNVKTSKLVRRLFGIEAEIGLKNLKRNKRRYRATVFSLVISIVLFLAVSFFTSEIAKSIVLSQDGIDYDIQISARELDQEYGAIFQSITSLEEVTESNLFDELTLGAWIEEEAVAGEWKKRIQEEPSLVQDGKVDYFINVSAMDDRSLQAYAEQVGANYEQLIDVDHPAAILIDRLTYQDMTGKFYETEAIDKEVGSVIELYQTDWETEETSPVGPVQVAAVTQEYAMGMNPSGLGGINVVISKRLLDAWEEQGLKVGAWAQLYVKSSDPNKTQEVIEEMQENQISVYNVYQSRQREEQMILLMSVFTYGFIALITLISVANIFNTISTSIALRKREFAMLRSVGMTPSGFNKMMNYESIFYGLQSLLYGLPISIAVMALLHRSMQNGFDYSFQLPWMSLLQVIIAVFVIVGVSMLYSSAKVKKEDIIEGLRQESA